MNIKWNRSLLSAAVMALCGVFLGMVSDDANLFSETQQPEIVTDRTGSIEPVKEELKPASAAEAESVFSATETASSSDAEPKTEGEERTAERLNLAFVYPEGVDSSDQTQSFAARAFQELTAMDQYQVSNVSYTFDDSFRELRLHVVNGDERPISYYSNVFEIMSMASVYTYYHDPENYELFLNYAKNLWELSHSCSMKLSELYYCSDCSGENLPEENGEETDGPEAGGMEADGIGEERIEVGGTETEGIEAGGTETEGIEAGGTETEGMEAGGTETEGMETGGTETEGMEAGGTETEGIEAGGTETEGMETGGTEAEGMEAGGIEIEGMKAVPGMTETEVPESDPEAVPESGAGESAVIVAGTGTVIPDESEIHTDSNAEPHITASASGYESAASELLDAEVFQCPGHMDLIVQMKIIGLDENQNLFSMDPIGNRKEFFTESWSGWNEETVSQVKNLKHQDWHDRYGLYSLSAQIGNALTSSEIHDYLAELPEDTSETRQNIIRFALESVGRIPYYYGGKASRTHYDGNHFSSVIDPDPKGRVLKGLDCSGWIGWLYWSVCDMEMPYATTSSLSAMGVSVAREALKPGDILLRKGDESHAGIFLGWTEEGAIRYIHESAGTNNNVVISVSDSDWTDYRSILDDR